MLEQQKFNKNPLGLEGMFVVQIITKAHLNDSYRQLMEKTNFEDIASDLLLKITIERRMWFH